jgi:hypothetical protein
MFNPATGKLKCLRDKTSGVQYKYFIRYNIIGCPTFNIGPKMVVILLMPNLLCKSIQNKKSMN